MRLCGECGLFCSNGLLWPVGVCLPRADCFIHPSDEGCVMWQKDWRGVDQSDGQDPNWKGGKNESDFASVHGEIALGAVDPGGVEDVRKPVFSRSPGLLFGSRVKQSQLF